MNPVRCEMKPLLLAVTALAVVAKANLSPAMANRFGAIVGINPDNPEYPLSFASAHPEFAPWRRYGG